MKYLFKSMIRNFVRKPITNLVNLIGLSVSLALVIILSVYCYSELTTDHFHKNGDRVYLFMGPNKNLYTPGILKEHIEMSVPGVKSTVRMSSTWDTPVFQVEDKEPITSDLLFVDEDFFKLFTYKVVGGNLETALKEPLSVVITKTLSERLFRREGAIDKTMKLNNGKELTVKAVIEEPSANSCISFSALTSIATRKIVQPEEGELTKWGTCNFHTFVLLKEGARPEETVKSISALFPKNTQKHSAETQLIPLKKIYFSHLSLYDDSNYLHCGDQKKVMILLMVAALVLMIALINFINISSSQWLEKIRQTGVMKVIGASHFAVLRHILGESFLLFLVSLFLAILLVGTTSDFINAYTGVHFNLRLLYSPTFLLVSISGIMILSALISLIPALRISSSKAVDNLKRTVEGLPENSILRGILVAVQFTIAITLISFTLLIQKQVNYGSSNLGFNQGNIIGIKLTPELDKKRRY